MKRLKFGVMVLGIASVSFLVLAAVACGGGQKGAPTPEPETDHHEHASTTATVGLHEWAVELDGDEVHAGDVTFQVTNHGAAPHELAILKADAPADDLEVHDGVVHEDDYELVGKIQDIMPGAQKEATFHLEHGTYVLLCNLPGHYQQGMYTTLTVK